MSESLGNESTNASWLQRHQAALPAACLRTYDPKHSVVISHGKGSRVWDVEGIEYIDLTCGYSTTNLGHANETLLRAATEQLASITHLTGQPHIGQIQLAERLIARLQHQDQEHGFPDVERKVVFNSSGARAIETAWRAAAEYRPGRLLSISPSFHGNTIALSAHSQLREVETEPYRRPAEEYPYCSRCPLGLSHPSCRLQCAASTFEFIEREAPSISAILIEPMLGARGYIAPPDDYFHQLSLLAKKHGIVTIADEVQTALGRSGSWTLSHSQDWQADLLVVGKSLGGGIAAISAVIGRAHILDCLKLSQVSETFAGTPIATSAALSVLDQIEQLGCIGSAKKIGQQLQSTVSTCFPATQVAGKQIRIQGLGASCCVEFLSESDSASADDALRFAVGCQAAGLLVHLSGPLRTRVVFLPALNITEDELADAQRRIKAACQDFDCR